jgi:hypothetical protein
MSHKKLNLLRLKIKPEQTQFQKERKNTKICKYLTPSRITIVQPPHGAACRRALLC